MGTAMQIEQLGISMLQATGEYEV